MELTGKTRRSSRLLIVCVAVVVAVLGAGVGYMRHVQSIENAALKKSLEQSERLQQEAFRESDERLKAAGVELGR